MGQQGDGGGFFGDIVVGEGLAAVAVEGGLGVAPAEQGFEFALDEHLSRLGEAEQVVTSAHHAVVVAPQGEVDGMAGVGDLLVQVRAVQQAVVQEEIEQAAR